MDARRQYACKLTSKCVQRGLHARKGRYAAAVVRERGFSGAQIGPAILPTNAIALRNKQCHGAAPERACAQVPIEARQALLRLGLRCQRRHLLMRRLQLLRQPGPMR